MKLFLLWTTVICVSATFLFGDCMSMGDNPYTKALMNNARWESVHGYVQVRPGAYLFYWFFYADGTKVDANKKPLIIWIQGGPGFAASGVGNFGEIGPFNMDMEPRNHTWVRGRNLLLIDHPVGTGFSHAIFDSLYAKTDRTMAIDLSRAIKMFFRRHRDFRKTPAYLIGQSYGGKLCPRLGLYLHTAIEKKSLKMNLKGIGIGGGWVNPRESISVQPDYLYQMGAIDRKLYLSASTVAKKVIQSLDKYDYSHADDLDDLLFNTLNEEDINYNNVNGANPYPALEELNNKINLYVKPTLIGVNQTRLWRYMAIDAYDKLKKNFLVPTTSFLETLLNKSKLRIAVYNGNLDVVTPIVGASNWVHKLKWYGAAKFSKTKRHPIGGNKNRNGFYKETENLSFWWVFGAGHWVPEENPEAMEHILQYLTKEEVKVTPNNNNYQLILSHQNIDRLLNTSMFDLTRHNSALRDHRLNKQH